MPRIRVEATADSAIGPVPNTRATDESFGAAKARALGQLGSAIKGFAGSLAGYASKQEQLNDNLEFTKFQNDMNQQFIQAAANAPENPEGFAKSWDEQFKPQMDKMLEGKTGARKQQLEQRLETIRGGFGAKAVGIEIEGTTLYQRNQIQTSMDDGVNAILSDPTQYDATVTNMDAVFSSMGLPPAEERKLRDSFTSNAAAARWQGLYDAAEMPEDVDGLNKALREDKQWQEKMSPQQYEQMLRYGQVKRNVLETKLQSDGEAALKDFNGRVVAGQEIPPSQLDEYEKRIARTGDDLKINTYAQMRSRYEEQKSHKGMTYTALSDREKETRPKEGAPSPSGIAATDLPPEAGIVLNMIAGPESGGRYDVQYRGGKITKFNDHPRDMIEMPDGRFSSASGRYQFIGSTWDLAAKGAGVTDFTPASQDKAAWYWAQKTFAQQTGGNLTAAVQRGDWGTIRRALGSQWEGLKHISDAKAQKYANSNLGSNAAEIGRHEAVVASQQAMAEGLAKDPVSYAASQGIIQSVALDPGEPASFATRASQFAAVQEAYGDAPVSVNKPFTEAEADQLKQVLASDNVDQKYAALAGVAAMGTVDEKIRDQAFAQIGEANSVEAYAGEMIAKGRGDVAKDILTGIQIQEQAGKSLDFRMGTDKERAEAFQSYVGTAMGGRPWETQNALAAADALYARASRAKAAFDPALYQEQVAKVLGAEIADAGASTTLTPPGVKAEQFEEFQASLTDEDLVNLSYNPIKARPVDGDGAFLPAEWFDEKGYWHSLKDGLYAFTDAMGNRVLDQNGQTYFMQVDANRVKSIVDRANAPTPQPPKATRKQMRDLGPAEPGNPEAGLPR